MYLVYRAASRFSEETTVSFRMEHTCVISVFTQICVIKSRLPAITEACHNNNNNKFRSNKSNNNSKYLMQMHIRHSSLGIVLKFIRMLGIRNKTPVHLSGQTSNIHNRMVTDGMDNLSNNQTITFVDILVQLPPTLHRFNNSTDTVSNR